MVLVVAIGDRLNVAGEAVLAGLQDKIDGGLRVVAIQPIKKLVEALKDSRQFVLSSACASRGIAAKQTLARIAADRRASEPLRLAAANSARLLAE